MNLLQSDVEELVPFILARAGYERRRIELDQSECRHYSNYMQDIF